jgi:hypothetical protein
MSTDIEDKDNNYSLPKEEEEVDEENPSSKRNFSVI